MKMTQIKVRNMTSLNGNDVPNQFIIDNGSHRYFQSYQSIITKVFQIGDKQNRITLDKTYWDYSRTTLKYLTQFLRHNTGEAINSKKDIEAKIKSGEYKLANLN